MTTRVVSDGHFKGGNGVVNTTANLTLTSELHAFKTVTVNKADGAAIVLPAATGSGDKYRLVIATAVTSNTTTVKVANSSDAFQGYAYAVSDNTNAVLGWKATAGTSDTVTLDGSTQGGLAGDILEFEDVAANLWSVCLNLAQTGTEATPFSATV